ncbi:MAG TPA: hypothetical protein VGV65_13965, partial [Nocardioides sp.]|nr:hypothetical protein [Nocardioides sp.]
LARVAAGGARTSLPGSGLLRRAAPALARQANLQVAPAELFGADRVVLRGRLDVVVLVMSQEGEDTVTRRATPEEVAMRMRASLEEERAPLMTYYRHFRYAFPGRTSALLDVAGDVESTLLEARLRDRPCMAVSHPHPCDIRAFADSVMAAVDDAVAPRSRVEVP